MKKGREDMKKDDRRRSGRVEDDTGLASEVTDEIEGTM